MRKTILTILGATLMASSMAQIASAAEHHRNRVTHPAQTTERLRDSNAFYAPEPIFVPASGNYANYSGAGR